MKRYILTFLLLSSVLLFAACAESNTETVVPEETGPDASLTETAIDPYADLAPMELVGADNSALGSAAVLFGEAVAKKVESITGGKLRIDYYPAGQLGSDAELLSQMAAGTIDIVLCPPAASTKQIPQSALFLIPYLFQGEDSAAVSAVLNQNSFAEALASAYQEAGYYALYFLPTGQKQELLAGKKLASIQDITGLKIGVQNEEAAAFWHTVGAQAMVYPDASALAAALASGEILAVESSVAELSTCKLPDTQPYLVQTERLIEVEQFLIAREAFEALPSAYQDALKQAVREAAAELEKSLFTAASETRTAFLSSSREQYQPGFSFLDELTAASSASYSGLRAAVGITLLDKLAPAFAEYKESAAGTGATGTTGTPSVTAAPPGAAGNSAGTDLSANGNGVTLPNTGLSIPAK